MNFCHGVLPRPLRTFYENFLSAGIRCQLIVFLTVCLDRTCRDGSVNPFLLRAPLANVRDNLAGQQELLR